MTAFATYSDMEARLGITMTVAEQTRAGILLTLASGLIQQATGQTISLVEGDELSVPSVYEDRFRLPERPVVSVDSVTLDDTEVSEEDYYLDGDELVRYRFPLGLESHFGNQGMGWLGPYYTLAVTYTHGYSTIPSLVKAVCVEMVTRVWTNPASVQAETFGSGQTTFGDYRSRVGLLLLDHEEASLNKLLRRQAGTVRLR